MMPYVRGNEIDVKRLAGLEGVYKIRAKGAPYGSKTGERH
jgi:hypothetical protein